MDVRDPIVALEKRAQGWGTGTALSPPPVLPCLHKTQSLDGSFVPEPPVVLLPSHRVLPSHPFRPRAATHQNSLGAQAFSEL